MAILKRIFYQRSSHLFTFVFEWHPTEIPKILFQYIKKKKLWCLLGSNRGTSGHEANGCQAEATTALKFHWWSCGKKCFKVIIQVKNWDFWKNLSFWSRMSLNFKTNFEFQFSLTFPATFSSTLSPEHFFLRKTILISQQNASADWEKKCIFHISFIS